MGIGGFIKGSIKELAVCRPDSAKEIVVWKHPDPTIPMYAQLTVYPDEVAIFFKDGKVVGVLNAGKYKLDSVNIPFLSNLIDYFTGGNLFRTEIYFVTTKEIPDVKFGGRIGELEDPETGLVAETMVHGTFSYRVVEPVKFVIGLVGLGQKDANQVESWLKQQVLKVLRDRVAELLVKHNWGLLKVTSGAYTEEIEEEVLKGFDPHLNSYGIKIIRLGNFVIGIDEEAKKSIREFKQRIAFQRGLGVGLYSQFQTADAIRDIGRGVAKSSVGDSGLLTGAVLGVGLGFGNMFQQRMSSQTQSPEHTHYILCAKCQLQLPPDTKFCPNCGTRLIQDTQKICPNCGSKVLSSANFCSNCGTKL